jgi:hypothetical protein
MLEHMEGRQKLQQPVKQHGPEDICGTYPESTGNGLSKGMKYFLRGLNFMVQNWKLVNAM